MRFFLFILFLTSTFSSADEFTIDYEMYFSVYYTYSGGQSSAGDGTQLHIGSETISIGSGVFSPFDDEFPDFGATNWENNGSITLEAGKEPTKCSVTFPAWQDDGTMNNGIYLSSFSREDNVLDVKHIMNNIDEEYASYLKPDHLGWSALEEDNAESHWQPIVTLYTAYLKKTSIEDLIPINDGDEDGDNIPDYSDREIGQHKFTELEIEIPGLAHIKEYYDELGEDYPKISISYHSSPPFEDSNYSDYLTEYHPASGDVPGYFLPPIASTRIGNNRYKAAHIRLWKNNAASRQKADIADGGDFVRDGSSYTFEELDMDGDSFSLYVEGTHATPDIQYISISLDGASISVPYEVGSDCTACESNCETGGECETSVNNNQLSGTVDTGSGRVRVVQDVPTSNISSPASLSFTRKGANEKAYYDEQNIIRQVKNDQGLTDIVVIDQDTYTISFYENDNFGDQSEGGFFSITGPAKSVTTISKPSGNINKLRFVRVEGNKTTLDHEFSYDQSERQWSLAEKILGSDNSKTLKSYDNQTLTTSTLDKHGAVLSKVAQTFYGSEQELITREVIDPDGAALTTIRGYNGSKQLTSVTYPDGSSETHSYLGGSNYLGLSQYSSGRFIKYLYNADGTLHKTIDSFNGSTYCDPLNENEHKVTEYSYAPLLAGDDGSLRAGEPRNESITILGQTVSTIYFGYLDGENVTIQAATATSGVNDPNNLATRTFFYTDGEYEDEVYKTINPDGSGSIISRDENSTTTDSGIFNDARTEIISGTSTTVATENDLEVSTITTDIATGLLISSRTVTSRDDRDRETEVEYHDGTYETFIYTCCNLDTSTSRDGVETTYTYDALDRQKTSTTNGVTRTNHYDALGNVVKVTETGTDSTVRTLSESHYNTAGQLAWTKDAQGKQTSYATSYPGDGTTIETTTYPNGKTRITTTDSEGDIVSVTGTGVFHEDADIHNEYVEFDAELGYHVHVQQYGKADNWTKTYTDALGRTYKTESSTGAITRDYYNTSGDVIKSVAANGAVSLFHSEPGQNLNIQALDVNQNDQIDYGVDVITRSQSDYIEENSIIYNRSRNWINPDSFANPGTPDNTRKISNHGLLLVNTSIANGITSTLKVITEIDTTGAITITSMAPDGTTTESQVTFGLQDWVKSYDKDGVLKSTIEYDYDNFNRLITQTDSRNGATTYTYDNSDRITVLKTPDPDGNGPEAFQEFKTFYTDMGQRDYVVHPDGSQINFSYTDQGVIENASGSQVYSRTYGYDNKGNLTSLTTTGQAGSLSLEWEYYDNGQLYKKTDARGREVTYTYYPSGQIKTKINARGIIKTWNYDNSGRLDSISYSDNGLTAGYSFTYNELGRLDTISDAGGDRKLNYNTLGQFTGYTWLSGALSGLEQSYTYDLTGRQKTAGFSINGISRVNTYLYNKFGLLEEVDDGQNKYKYSYLDQSPHTVEAVEVEQNGTIQLHSKRAFDKLMRTTGLEWATGAKE
ncbi:MAG: hypothetical protein MK132_17820 [Lentisphaerales bacterium]|nr:hypothetical protein [Lentisphaerales bacterium]